MHHGDIGLLGEFVVLVIDDDLVHSSGLDVRGALISLAMQAQHGTPQVHVDILPGSKNEG